MTKQIVLLLLFVLLSCSVGKKVKQGIYHYRKSGVEEWWEISVKENDSVFIETNRGQYRKSKGVIKQVSKNKYKVFSYDTRDSTNLPMGIIPSRLDIVGEELKFKNNKLIFRGYVLKRQE